MRKQTSLSLRNKIILHLNQWQQLGCRVREFVPYRPTQNRFIWRLVSGVAKDGRAILIWPILDRRRKIPRRICALMVDYEGRGAIVGCAPDIGAAWDIVYADETKYKRKAYTWAHRYWSEKYQNSKGNEE